MTDSTDLEAARKAALLLYERGLAASSVVRALKQGGHSLAAVAYAARQCLPPLDVNLFGEAWGGNGIERRDARGAFWDAE